MRLKDVDAAELDGNQRGEALRCKQYLQTLIEGKAIELMVQRQWPDKYGRVLATIYFRGENINRKLVLEGYAHEWHGALIV